MQSKVPGFLSTMVSGNVLSQVFYGPMSWLMGLKSFPGRFVVDDFFFVLECCPSKGAFSQELYMLTLDAW